MSAGNDRQFVEQVKRQLDRHAAGVDDLTAARLGAARRRALHPQQRVPHRWLPTASLATAAAALLAVLVLMQPLHRSEPDGELWMTQDDIEVIEELDFYAWLEATQPSG